MATSERVNRIRKALESNTPGVVIYAKNAKLHQPWAKALAGDRKVPRSRDPKEAAEELAKNSALKGAFPDGKVTVEDIFEVGDKVVVRWRLRGTHSGAVAGIRPTKRPVDVTGINIYRFRGNLVVESWGEVDSAGLAKQACERVLDLVGRPPEAVTPIG
jgi:predicted ester cyclase